MIGSLFPSAPGGDIAKHKWKLIFALALAALELRHSQGIKVAFKVGEAGRLFVLLFKSAQLPAQKALVLLDDAHELLR